MKYAENLELIIYRREERTLNVLRVDEDRNGCRSRV